ncbi:MAG: transglutaminase domain-containing protein [Candidatus Bathyarchaeia archaeon]
MRNNSPKQSQKHPQIVEIYQRRYEKMATPEYRAELINFAKYVLQDPIENLDWKELLDWEHRHLKYTREELPKPRAELPIQIIHQSKGRCGEFALLYNGLLLANGYKSRIVIDCSTLKDKSRKAAGDHVWVEIFINNRWVHVDPTEKRIDQPLMYIQEWNKDVNLVYALTDKEILDVTKTYQPK